MTTPPKRLLDLQSEACACTDTPAGTLHSTSMKTMESSLPSFHKIYLSQQQPSIWQKDWQDYVGSNFVFMYFSLKIESLILLSPQSKLVCQYQTIHRINHSGQQTNIIWNFHTKQKDSFYNTDTKPTQFKHRCPSDFKIQDACRAGGDIVSMSGIWQ